MSKVAAPLLQTREPPLHHQNTPPKILNPLRANCLQSCTDKRLRPWLNKPVFRLQPRARAEPSSAVAASLPVCCPGTNTAIGTERKANSSITTQASQLLAVKSVVELNIRFYKPKSYLLLLACSAVEVPVY